MSSQKVLLSKSDFLIFNSSDFIPFSIELQSWTPCGTIQVYIDKWNERRLIDITSISMCVMIWCSKKLPDAYSSCEQSTRGQIIPASCLWNIIDECKLQRTEYKRLCTLRSHKGKAIPLQASTGPEGSRRLRLPDFRTIGTWRW